MIGCEAVPPLYTLRAGPAPRIVQHAKLLLSHAESVRKHPECCTASQNLLEHFWSILETWMKDVKAPGRVG
jgi:hypothetical protein